MINTKLPAIAALLQIPWFIILSIARVRMGGTSALPIVKFIDLLMPLPTLIGFVAAAILLWRTGGQGGLWLWGGGIACAIICAGFIWLMANN